MLPDRKLPANSITPGRPSAGGDEARAGPRRPCARESRQRASAPDQFRRRLPTEQSWLNAHEQVADDNMDVSPREFNCMRLCSLIGSC